MASCIGSKGEAVVASAAYVMGMDAQNIQSITGFAINNKESLAEYSFSTFEIKIK